MKIENGEDVAKADAFVALNKALVEPIDLEAVRVALAAALDVTNPGWRKNPAWYLVRVKELGLTASAEALLARYQA